MTAGVVEQQKRVADDEGSAKEVSRAIATVKRVAGN